MNREIRFKDAYNRLDKYLKDLVKARGDRNMIYCYQQILPEKKSAMLETIRKTKNLIVSHGVSINGSMPTIPEEWIKWLNNEIEYCKNNRDSISKMMRTKLQEISRNKNNGKTSNTKTVNTTNKVKQPKQTTPKKVISNPVVTKSYPVYAAPTRVQPSNGSASNSDECISLKAELLEGYGLITEGFIKTRKLFNFILNVNIFNPQNYTILKATAYIKSGGYSITKQLSRDDFSSTSINLEYSKYNGNVSVVVEVKYLIGFFQTKKIDVNVSKKF